PLLRNRAWPRRLLIAGAALVGGVLLVVGSFLPWLRLFAGIDSYSGESGTYGRVLVAGGIASCLVAALYLARPERRFRLTLEAIGFCLAAVSAWVVYQLFATYQELKADPMLLASLASGVFI